MWEHAPILAAAVKASIALADLDRELMRFVINPHGMLRHEDGAKDRDVRRA